MANLNIRVDDILKKQADPFFSAENQARLLAAKERMEKSGGTVHELIEADHD